MASNMRVLVVFLLLASIVATGTQASVSCDTVMETIYPCVPYVTQGGKGPVPATCCNSIKMLKELAKSVQDRKDTCACIKTLLTQVPPDYLSIVSSLPEKCFVDLTYKINPTMDCNSIP